MLYCGKKTYATGEIDLHSDDTDIGGARGLDVDDLVSQGDGHFVLDVVEKKNGGGRRWSRLFLYNLAHEVIGLCVIVVRFG